MCKKLGSIIYFFFMKKGGLFYPEYHGHMVTHGVYPICHLIKVGLSYTFQSEKGVFPHISLPAYLFCESDPPPPRHTACNISDIL